MYVHFLIQSAPDSVESGVRACLRVTEPSKLTLSTVRKLFPYEGTFHFRLKINEDGESAGGPYVWLDLLDSKQNVFDVACNFGGIQSEGSEPSIHFKVLPLSLDPFEAAQDECSDEELANWEENAFSAGVNSMSTKQMRDPYSSDAKRNQDFDQRQHRALKEQREKSPEDWKSTVENKFTIAMSSKTADDIRNAAKQGLGTAKKLLSRMNKPISSLPTHAAMSNLEILFTHYSTKFNEAVPTHLELMQTLWKCVVQGDQMQPVSTSEQWQLIGFESNSLHTELSGTGILCLQNIVRLLSNAASVEIFRDNARRSSNFRYPFGAVCKGLTLTLCSIFHFERSNFVNLRAPYWHLFEDFNFFYLLFLWSFQRFHTIWGYYIGRNQNLQTLLTQIKVEIEGSVQYGPSTLKELTEYIGKKM